MAHLHAMIWVMQMDFEQGWSFHASSRKLIALTRVKDVKTLNRSF